MRWPQKHQLVSMAWPGLVGEFGKKGQNRKARRNDEGQMEGGEWQTKVWGRDDGRWVSPEKDGRGSRRLCCCTCRLRFGLRHRSEPQLPTCASLLRRGGGDGIGKGMEVKGKRRCEGTMFKVGMGSDGDKRLERAYSKTSFKEIF